MSESDGLHFSALVAFAKALRKELDGSCEVDFETDSIGFKRNGQIVFILTRHQIGPALLAAFDAQKDRYKPREGMIGRVD